MIEGLGIASAVVMPVFNIPLIVRILRRRSSEDISIVWVVGVWLCILGMLPASLLSTDRVLKAYGVINTVFFTAVVGVVLFFHPSIRRR